METRWSDGQEAEATKRPVKELPEEFLRRMKERLKEEYPAFLASYEAPPVQALRRNPGKVEKEEFEAGMPFSLEPVPWSENGYYYGSQDAPGRHPYHEAGLYYIQEPSAQAVAEWLAAEPGEWILDLCAAPGGKTTQIGAAMQGKGLLVSNEIHPGRAAILSENVERMGLANVLVLNETPQRLAAAFPGCFDRIAVDAPCSGEGMFRRSEEARREWSYDAVHMCVRRQEEILKCAAGMLKEGGILCYSTCTFSEEENEICVERFLQTHPNFHPEKSLRMWPHKIRGEGHFIALLRKQSEGGTAMGSSGKKQRGGMCTERPAHPGECGAFYEFVRECMQPDALPENLEKRLLLFGDQLYLMPEQMPALRGLRVLRPGLHLGTFKGGKRRFLPSHALALALHDTEVQRVCDLSSREEGIRQYLSGQTLPLTGEKGWYLVTVDGYSIGWGKASGGILKNHYPKGLRKNL